MSDYEKCVDDGVIGFGDDFFTRKEVMKLFGKESGGVGKSGIVEVENGSVCFFDEKGMDGWNHVRKEGERLDRRGWNEVIEVENYYDEGVMDEEEMEYEGNKKRYVFGRMNWKGMVWWKFLGVFDFEGKRLNDEGVIGWVWKKIGDEVELVRGE